MKKNLILIILFLFSYLINANEILTSTLFESNLQNISLYGKLNKNIDKDAALLKTGFIMTIVGGTSLLTGGFFIGFSYLAAWYAIWDFIGTPEFTIKNWGKVWQIIFAYPGYTYTTLASSLMISGIILTAIGAVATTTGIVFLIYSIYQYKKRGEKPSLIKKRNYSIQPLDRNLGIKIAF